MCSIVRVVLAFVAGAFALASVSCSLESAQDDGGGVFTSSSAMEFRAPLPGRGTDVFANGAPELQGFPLNPARRAPASAPRARLSSASACGQAALPTGLKAGQTTLRSITSGGMKRTFRLHVPLKASNTAAMPLVLNFHGRTATGIDQEILSGLVPLSDRETFVLVSPDGTGTPMGWSAGATPANSIDDVKFADDIITQLSRELCIDQTRIYATGFSNGAFMSSKLACTMPDRIAAIAVVGGVDYPAEGCKARVPVLAIHGTGDEVVPLDGGLVRSWKYPGAQTAMENWAANNACSQLSEEVVLTPGVVRETFAECAAATEFVTVDKAGHVWPGGPGCKPGTPEASISAAELVWRFLGAKRLPAS